MSDGQKILFIHGEKAFSRLYVDLVQGYFDNVDVEEFNTATDALDRLYERCDDIRAVVCNINTPAGCHPELAYVDSTDGNYEERAEDLMTALGDLAPSGLSAQFYIVALCEPETSGLLLPELGGYLIVDPDGKTIKSFVPGQDVTPV